MLATGNRLTTGCEIDDGEDYWAIDGCSRWPAKLDRPLEVKVEADRAVKAMIFPPDLPQPKVNKCLIALVTKKVVVKNNVGVSCSLFDQEQSSCAGNDLVQMGRLVTRLRPQRIVV